MKPIQPNTKRASSSHRPPSRQTSQQTPLIINLIDESSTESESEQPAAGVSPLESDPDDYDSALHLSPPENQQGLEEWKRQQNLLRGIPEVPEPAGES